MRFSGYLRRSFYQWQELTPTGWVDIPGANALTHTVTLTNARLGTYSYRMSMAERANFASFTCRVNSAVLTMSVNSPPSQALSGSTSYCEGQSMTLGSDIGDSYSWTGPNNFSADTRTITIVRLRPFHSGTYTVVIKRKGCVVTAAQDVAVYPAPIADGGADQVICVGNSATLQASGGISYSWSPVQGLSNPNIADPVASPNNTTTYSVTVTGIGGCVASDTVRVTVIRPATAKAGSDKIIHEGQSVVLDGSFTGRSFYWLPAAGLNSVDSLRPIAAPSQNTTYTLYATSGDPCNFVATDQVFVRVYQKVIIPNTFTPNNDGVNDTWNIAGLSTYPTSLTQIFNRQGDLVYQTQGYGKAWDGTFNGKQLPAGVYYYKIDLNIGSPIRTGWVSILR